MSDEEDKDENDNDQGEEYYDAKRYRDGGIALETEGSPEEGQT